MLELWCHGDIFRVDCSVLVHRASIVLLNT